MSKRANRLKKSKKPQPKGGELADGALDQVTGGRMMSNSNMIKKDADTTNAIIAKMS